jgi:hypothetical protein
MATSQSTTTKTDPGKKIHKKTERREYLRQHDGSDSSDGSDGSADEVKPDKSQLWKRPNGYDPGIAQYRGWRTWTPGQWAWEFLRRSPEFQGACRGLAGNSADALLVAEKFHLARFKDFREGYDNITPLFARSIKVFPNLELFEERLKGQGDDTPGPWRTKTYAPRDNEVVITFRLEPSTHVGTTNLTRQLRQAERKLKKYLAALLKARSHGSGAQTLDPEDLFKKLRSLDLAMHGLRMSDIAFELSLVNNVHG